LSFPLSLACLTPHLRGLTALSILRNVH